MTAVALGAGQFAPPGDRPPWLRPAAIAFVAALHALALSTLPYLASKPPERPKEIVVEIVPAPPPEAPKEPAAPPPAPPPEEAAPPLPPVEAPSVETPPPPAVEAPPPVVEPAPPPPPIEIAPPKPPPPPPVELAPPKPPPPATRVEQPKPQLKAIPRPAPKPERAQPKTRETEREHASLPKPPATQPARPSAVAPAANAASQSAYISAVAGTIRSRLFYPPAARARGAKGVVGVAFTIGASGAVAAFAITRSSGDEDLDAAARTLVESARFPPPPGGSARVATSFNYIPR